MHNSQNRTRRRRSRRRTFLLPSRLKKVITIPLSTYDAAPLLHTYDDSPQRWANGTSNGHQEGVIIDQFRCAKTITIEGGTSTVDTTSIGGGVNDLRLVITAQQNDIIERNYDQLTTRGGGGGGGGAVLGVPSSSGIVSSIVSSGSGGQTPPTPQATGTTTASIGQKTLLNTSPNLLPITTATDTFNNLKNLVKIDKGSTPASNHTGNYRANKSGGGSDSSLGGRNGNRDRTSGSIGVGVGVGGVGASSAGAGGVGTVGGPSGHYSSGYNKNSVKIRQHDSELSPRPRRSYQNDSSSSRYYNKNSDILGPSSNNNNNIGIGSNQQSLGNSNADSSYNLNGSGLGVHRGSRNSYHTSSDGGSYNRNLNSNSGSNYRSNNNSNGSSRYETVNGNGNSSGQQQRHYGSNSTSGGRNSINSNPNKSNYASQRTGNDGNLGHSLSGRYRDDYTSNRDNYRDRDSYGDDSPAHQRYNSGGGSSGSLERNGHTGGPGEGGAGGGGGGNRYNNRSHNDSLSSSGGRNSDERYERGQNLRHNNQAGSTNVSLSQQQHQQQQQQQQQQQVYVKSVTPPPVATASSSSSSGSGSGAAAQQLITGRWIPPSLRPQHGLTQSEKNDAVFRRVRGILNKLTPEKFQELSDELLKLDLNSIVILNGVILLIFDKALDEPKYSSMYAQLCKRLSEEAPSFEKEPNNSCTFLRLLIAVCRDKFNNRLKRDEANDNRPPPENEADEEERRHLAKQRMLGNVKFIGELNKLDMLSKNVLHACIMELLDKKKKRTASAQEMCEDMECLAQLLKTCGKNLDSEQGKELMNQYFETLERRSKSTEYPPRIRFMLKDVIELRLNHWIPRKVGGSAEGPVPIKQIRSDDDSIIRTPFANRNRDMRNNDRDGDSWMNRFHLNLQTGGYNDMFSGLSVTGSSPIVSPFSTSNSNRDRDRERDNRQYNNRDRNRDQGNNSGGSGGGNGNYNNRYNKHNNQNGGGNVGGNRDESRGGSGGGSSHRNNDRNNDGGQYGGNQLLLGSKELAPRFKRNLITTNQDSVENLQMRPAANSLLFRAASQNQKFPTSLPISTPPSGNSSQQTSQLSNSHYPLLGTPTSHLMPNPTRPSSTPSAEYGLDNRNLHNAQQQAEKSLKTTSSSPNFGSVGQAYVENNTERKTAVTETKEQVAVERPTTPSGSGSGSASGSSKQQKKDKGPSKEELTKKANAYFKEKFYYDEQTEDALSEEGESALVEGEGKGEGSAPDQFTQLVEGFLELKLPEKSLKDVCLNLLMEVLDRVNDVYLERIVRFLQALRKQSNIKPNVIVEIFKQLVNKMNEREALNPRITALVASVLSKTVCEPALLKLSDIANYTDNGQHYPLFLLVLQQLHKTIGKDALEEKFRASKIDLMNSLQEVDRNKERLGEILEDRQLSFLYPLLKVQAEMLKQLQSDPNPNNFYKWIKSNVDNKYYKDPGFVQALMTVVVKYITKETTLANNMDPKEHPEKSVTQKEQAMLETYSQMLQTFLSQNELQLMALYALQLFCYNESFPKGMLCRWFKYLYDSEIIEEEAFVLWKEEISDKYPGKGSALFQVNAWLTWLQEAESEDDED
ncbi:eukaryotic translation initiation factor 4 gamma 2 [Drosophila innubila]|uniref:eukaryotic translation initiation factor 4 gamma 2 n=1 Tax=Drosophila innubila TaxID=198719 RepID=UPI00148B4166|nr:eukaryotic translation initiation factor 4 gamma 2 [Drosophila innubila]